MQTMPNKNRPTIVVGALVLAILLGLGAMYTMKGRKQAETPMAHENPSTLPTDTASVTPNTTTDTTSGTTPAMTTPAGTSTPATAVAKDVPDTYVVKVGDTLSSISTQYYGTPIYAGDIEEMNKEMLQENPNHLEAGWTLKLPKMSEIPH